MTLIRNVMETNANEVLSKLKILPNTIPTRAVQQVREYLDSHPNPLKAANAILNKYGVPPLDNCKKAYVFAMTSVEQSLNNNVPKIESIINKANERIERITDILGSGAFTDYTNVNSETSSPDRKGGKRKIAMDLYLEHKDKGDKFVIELIQKELQVTKQNAYTYVYLVKKDLKL